MLKRCLLTLVLVGIASGSAFADKFKRHSIYYDVNLEHAKPEVTLRFHGNKSGTTILNVPAFSSALACGSFQVKSLSGAQDHSTKLVSSFASECVKESGFYCKKYQIQHPPEDLLEVRYKLLDDCRCQAYGVFVDPKVEYLFSGESLFLFPELSDTNNPLIKIEWNHFDAKRIKIIDQVGEVSKFQNRASNSIKNLLDSWFYLGDKKIYHTEYSTQYPKLKINTIGFPDSSGDNKTYTHKNISEMVKKIVTANQPVIDKILQSKNNKVQSFLIMHSNASRFDNQGRAMTNDSYFILTQTKKKDKDNIRLKQIISHEFMHQLFNGNLNTNFGPKKYKAYKYETLAPYFFWFTEGMNDYFASKLNLKSGIFNTDEYLAIVNDQIDQYYFNLRLIHILLTSAAGSEDIGDHESIFDQSAINRLSRRVGYLFSLNVDNIIQVRTDGKYDIIDLLKHSAVKCRDKRHCQLEKEDFIKGYAKLEDKKFLIDGFDAYLTTHIEKFMPLELFGYILNNKAILTHKKGITQNFGFNFESTMLTGVISGVSPKSKAFQAGLRDSQKLKRIEFGKKLKTDIKIKILTQEGILKTFSYDMFGEGLIPQYIKSDSTSR